VKDFFIEAELTDKIFGTACRCRIVAYALDGQEVEVFIPDIFHEERNPFNHVCLEVDDRKSLVAACEDAGVSINKISRGDKLLIFINDFDGNMFEIKERVRS
jgi:catechol 2,3-dioxygenase-like lactoylglutathione lyase family enzyme